MIRNLLKNSSSNVLILLIRLSITFVMSPIIVRALGNHDYGIWEMIMSVIGYVGILDLGMQPAIVRYVARYNALSDEESLHKLYSTSFLFLVFVGMVSFFILTGWAFFKPEVLAERGTAPYRYFLLLLLLGFQLLIKFPGYVAECFQLGYQRYILRNTVNIVLTLIASTTLIFLLLKGYGLIVMALVGTLETFIKVAIHIILVSLPKYGNYVFKKSDVSWKSLKEPLIFGYKSLINYISGILAVSTDSLVIAAFLGPIAVTFYSIPARLVLTICALLGALTLSLMPFFSELDAYGDKTKVVQAMTIASKFIAGIMVPILLTSCFLGTPFISCWMGPEYAVKGRLVLYILAGAYVLLYLNPCHNHFLTGLGSHGFLAKMNLTSAIVNLILSLIFVRYLGKEGAALGTFVASIIFTPIILSYTCKCLNISIWKYINDVVLPLIIPNVILVVLLLATVSNYSLDNYFKVVGTGLFTLTIYILLFLFFSLRKEEKNFIFSKARGLYRKSIVV
jgi:O-antigen/teichoic acid export membrane protein